MIRFVKRGLIHAYNFTTITQCVVKQLSSDLVTVLPNVVKFIPQSFEAIAQLQAELCLVKFGKLDACIRPIFTNLVTYYQEFIIVRVNLLCTLDIMYTLYTCVLVCRELL